MNKIHQFVKYRLSLLLWRIVPISGKAVVFNNYNGKGYGDSAKEIADKLLSERPDFKLYWLSNDKKQSFPDGVSPLVYDSIRSYIIMGRAKFLFSNVKHGHPYRKKEGQFYIQLWHGDFGPKYIEREIEDKLPQWYVKLSIEDSAITDAVIVGNHFFQKIVEKSFWLPSRCSIKSFGEPRNDIFFRDNSSLIDRLKASFGIPKEGKVLLYAPTFRDDGDSSVYNLNFEHLIHLLNQTTSCDWYVIIRFHPNVNESYCRVNYNKHILNGCNTGNPQWLSIISDALITDYSSIVYDFMLMRKPAFLYVPDLEAYNKCQRLRDVFFKYPYPICNNQNVLEKSLRVIQSLDYVKNIDEFLKSINSYDDGRAAERVVNYIQSL